MHRCFYRRAGFTEIILVYDAKESAPLFLCHCNIRRLLCQFAFPKALNVETNRVQLPRLIITDFNVTLNQ